ncbi:MAG: hypothetical protein KDC75_23750, partial [Phaeodactylibacter sp.]|nr:hypothetical protein [Phaeodactylibacter sp.]
MITWLWANPWFSKLNARLVRRVSSDFGDLSIFHKNNTFCVNHQGFLRSFSTRFFKAISTENSKLPFAWGACYRRY